MPRDDIESLRQQVAIGTAEVAALDTAMTAIAELRNSSEAEDHRRGCARAAGSIAARISDAESSLQEAKRALAKAAGDEHRQP
jgi:hypothetical protein